MLELNKIYCMDNISGMALLDNNCVDLTVTSPPYDKLRKYKGFTWDFENVAKQLYRVTKDGGVLVWVVNDATILKNESGTSFEQALYFKKIGFNLYDTMIYAKENPMPGLGHNIRYNPSFEYMFVFSKKYPKSINLIRISCKNKGNEYTGKEKWGREINGNLRSKPNLTGTKVHDTKVKNNIWFYSIGSKATSTDKIFKNHPAVFPEKLAEDHILSWSNEGDLILDPFMGSGTTAKMAMINNRNYIGFELSQEYCNIAEKRLEKYNKHNILLPGD